MLLYMLYTGICPHIFLTNIAIFSMPNKVCFPRVVRLRIGWQLVRLLSICSACKTVCSLVILNASVARTENPSESFKFAWGDDEDPSLHKGFLWYLFCRVPIESVTLMALLYCFDWRYRSASVIVLTSINILEVVTTTATKPSVITWPLTLTV